MKKEKKKKRKSLSLNSDFTKSPRGPGASQFFYIQLSADLMDLYLWSKITKKFFQLMITRSRFEPKVKLFEFYWKLKKKASHEFFLVVHH